MTRRDNLKLVLASKSPRRSELIALTGWQVAVRPVDMDEAEKPGEDGLSLARRLAEQKARLASEQFGNNAYILAADTVVECEGEILGKPASADNAQVMLLSLRGRSHQVHTAIALLDPRTGRIQVDTSTTNVPMRAYDRQEIAAYIHSGSPFDKAGAYGIQDRQFRPVEVDQMAGCYANVVGLPLCHVVRSFRELGHEPVFDVPVRCQAHTGYDCGVYPQILRDEK